MDLARLHWFPGYRERVRGPGESLYYKEGSLWGGSLLDVVLWFSQRASRMFLMGHKEQVSGLYLCDQNPE